MKRKELLKRQVEMRSRWQPQPPDDNAAKTAEVPEPMTDTQKRAAGRRELSQRLQQEQAASKVHVGLSVKMSIAEFRGWPAENVEAFMKGVAEVLIHQP